MYIAIAEVVAKDVNDVGLISDSKAGKTTAKQQAGGESIHRVWNVESRGDGFSVLDSLIDLNPSQLLTIPET